MPVLLQFGFLYPFLGERWPEGPEWGCFLVKLAKVHAALLKTPSAAPRMASMLAR
jgi:hypothetical protein